MSHGVTRSYMDVTWSYMDVTGSYMEVTCSYIEVTWSYMEVTWSYMQVSLRNGISADPNANDPCLLCLTCFVAASSLAAMLTFGER